MSKEKILPTRFGCGAKTHPRQVARRVDAGLYGKSQSPAEQHGLVPSEIAEFFRDCRERCNTIKKLESEIARRIIREFEDWQKIEQLQDLYDSACEAGIRRAEESTRLKSFLQKLEWIRGRCPVCERVENDRHACDCWLAEACK